VPEPRAPRAHAPGLLVDVAFLSRLRFAVTIGFHCSYPPLSIGLGVLCLGSEGAPGVR